MNAWVWSIAIRSKVDFDSGLRARNIILIGSLVGMGPAAIAFSNPRVQHNQPGNVPHIRDGALASGITIFESVDKNLGLELESVKHGIPVVVVDRVNRTATDN